MEGGSGPRSGVHNKQMFIIGRFTIRDPEGIEGFLNTLNKCYSQISHWVCEKRGTCKARLTTNERTVVKPCK